MVRILKNDKSVGIATLEIRKEELEIMVDSLNIMADRQQRILLENLPADDIERLKLENYKALKENLRKVLESIQ